MTMQNYIDLRYFPQALESYKNAYAMMELKENLKKNYPLVVVLLIDIFLIQIKIYHHIIVLWKVLIICHLQVVKNILCLSIIIHNLSSQSNETSHS